MNHYIISALLFCFVTTLTAQEPHFLIHDIGDENSGIGINEMLQDHRAMIWFATDQGLARYDGIDWHQVQLSSDERSVKVTSLFEDKDGVIWIGTDIGQIFYLDKARRVHFFSIEEGHPAKAITSILQDDQGFLWFATYGEGVYVYTGRRLFNLSVDDGLSGNDIYSMTITRSGEVWVGTDDGISVCTFKNERKDIRHYGLKEGLPDQIITSLKSDKEGNVWIGTFENGVVVYDVKTHSIRRPFDNIIQDEITAIEFFDDTELWIGTRKNGCWRYHPESAMLRAVVELNKMHSGEITDLLSDVEGNIWVTMSNGMLLSAFRPFESLTTDIGEVQTLFCDHLDRLWIGSKNGLYRIKENSTANSSTIRVAPEYNFNITDIIEDRFHNLWIGTIDQGLYLFSPDGKLKRIISKQLGGSTIMSMAVSQKKIWVATLEGVVFYPTDKNLFLDNVSQFQLVDGAWQSNLHFVFQVFVDSKDRSWFATDGNGIYSIDGETVTQHTGDGKLLIRSVYSICEDHNGHLWFNTPDNGLIEYDGRNYNPLGLAEGLGNMSVASIAQVGTGDILIAHHRGIDVMEPDRRHFMYYTDEAGVKEIDPGFNSVATTSEGHAYLSGQNRIIKYYASKNKLSIHPRTQLTRISVFEQSIDPYVVTKFPYHDNYITFEYAGLWYTSPQSVNYQYKLEGYDRQWKESKDHVASYSSLPPGKYTFYVKASENRFFLDEPLTSYSFEIAKPFWFQYWFVVSIVVAGGLLFWWIIKSRERRSSRDAVMRKEMIESQLQALKAQINPHFLFNSFNTLITIIDENADNPEVAIEYVEKLSDFFRSILQYREQETISLEEEWELVQNFGYLLQKRYGTNLRLHMGKPPKDAYILPLTLQMLVENAVKHNIISEQRPLDVYIHTEDDCVVVSNNLQPKSKTEPSTQFGLQSIIRRYNLLTEQKVTIDQDNNTFKVCIPIIKRNHE